MYEQFKMYKEQEPGYEGAHLYRYLVIDATFVTLNKKKGSLNVGTYSRNKKNKYTKT